MLQVLTGVAGIAGIVMWVADRMLGRSAPPKGAPRPPARGASPRFTPDQTARFTRIDAGGRMFDVARARSIVETLRLRSATQIPLPGVDPRSGVYAWEIGPLRGDRECAADVFDRASARGMILLGSLSMILLRTGHQVESVLIAAPNAMIGAHLASPHGELAILRTEEPEIVRAPAEPVIPIPAPTVTPPAAEAAPVVVQPPAPPEPQPAAAAPASAPVVSEPTVAPAPAPAAEPAVIGQVAFPKRQRKDANGAASPKQEGIDEPSRPAANA